MKLRRLGAATLAAALMATTTAIVVSADYATDGAIDNSDFGAQVYGMGTTNWSWVTGQQGNFEDTTLTLEASAADLNGKGDDNVQFGIQFFLATDSKGNGELAIGDSYTATVKYTLEGDNGTISEGTVDIAKTVEKNQWGPGIDGTFTVFSEEIAKDQLEGYGNVKATLEISDMTYTKAAAEEEAAPAETTAAATGDVAAATDSSKGSPDTGIEDVAAVAGLAVVAAGAVVLAKKRK